MRNLDQSLTTVNTHTVFVNKRIIEPRREHLMERGERIAIFRGITVVRRSLGRCVRALPQSMESMVDLTKGISNTIPKDDGG